jgi:hypothetical protein
MWLNQLLTSLVFDCNDILHLRGTTSLTDRRIHRQR